MTTPEQDIHASATARWPTALIILHWSTVGLLALGVASIYGREAVDARWLRDGLLNSHRVIGMLVWVGCWLRLAVRLRRRPQIPKAASQGLEKWAAAATHVALYALLLATPLLGWALSSARGHALGAFGLSLPPLVDTDPDLADELADAHQWAFFALLGLASIHAAAAAWHHLIRRDGVLAAMLPARATPQTTAASTAAPLPSQPTGPLQ